MKSGGVLWSPTNANALPGSDKLVPKTTIPENRDCAAAHPGVASTTARQLTNVHRVKDVGLRPVLTMPLPSNVLEAARS